MKVTKATELLAALAQENRLEIYRYLVQAGEKGLAVGQISEHFELSGATLSFHLKNLKQAGLIHCTRQGRSLIYCANYAMMNELLDYLMENCCGGHACRTLEYLEYQSMKEDIMTQRCYNILFLCTGNSARSIMAESLMRRWGGARFNAYSAGSHPAGEVNPFTLQFLQQMNFSIEGLRSKSWDEFTTPDAPHLDFVITVCDKAANEVCPIWPGQPLTSHWGVADPVAVEGNEEQKMQAFREAFRILDNRIKLFTALQIEGLERLRLKEKMDELGKIIPAPEASA